MEKEKNLEDDIRLLLNLNLINLSARSDEKYELESSEAGLSVIGSLLEDLESRIGSIWALYENVDNDIIINYPKSYSLKTDFTRLEEAEKNLKMLDKIPSKTFQRYLLEKTIYLLTNGNATNVKQKEMVNEIDKSEILVIDSKTIIDDSESGLLSKNTASQIRGYPNGEAEKAAKEHAERLRRIAISQTPGGGAARGVIDLELDSKNSSKKEKKNFKSDSEKIDKTRGEGNANNN